MRRASSAIDSTRQKGGVAPEEETQEKLSYCNIYLGKDVDPDLWRRRDRERQNRLVVSRTWIKCQEVTFVVESGSNTRRSTRKEEKELRSRGLKYPVHNIH